MAHITASSLDDALFNFTDSGKQPPHSVSFEPDLDHVLFDDEAPFLTPEGTDSSDMHRAPKPDPVPTTKPSFRFRPCGDHFSSPVTHQVRTMQDATNGLPHGTHTLLADTQFHSFLQRPALPTALSPAASIRIVLQEFSMEPPAQQQLICAEFMSVIRRLRSHLPSAWAPPAFPRPGPRAHPPPPFAALAGPAAHPRARAPGGGGLPAPRALAPALGESPSSASTAQSSGVGPASAAAAPAAAGAAAGRAAAGGRSAAAGGGGARGARGDGGASRHCHICCRPARAGEAHVACGNFAARASCRKSVCARCFADVPWRGKVSLAAARAQGPAWLCPHCADACPDRAQCFVYRRTSERRRQRRNARRAAAAAAAAARAAPQSEQGAAPPGPAARPGEAAGCTAEADGPGRDLGNGELAWAKRQKMAGEAGIDLQGSGFRTEETPPMEMAQESTGASPPGLEKEENEDATSWSGAEEEEKADQSDGADERGALALEARAGKDSAMDDFFFGSFLSPLPHDLTV